MKETNKMKKLMIAAAIVGAAAFVQAASFDWTSAENLTIDVSSLEAGKTYTAAGDNIDDAGWASDLGYTLVLSYGGKTDTITGTGPDTDFFGGISTTLSSSLVEKGTSSFNIDYTLTYTYTLTDGGKTWDLTSNTIEGTFEVPALGNIALSTDGVSSWSTAAVPEPTSGLLLLLGMAGLALRRRRA